MAGTRNERRAFTSSWNSGDSSIALQSLAGSVSLRLKRPAVSSDTASPLCRHSLRNVFPLGGAGHLSGRSASVRSGNIARASSSCRGNPKPWSQPCFPPTTSCDPPRDRGRRRRPGRLAALDSARPLTGRILLGEIDGVLAVARSLETGRTIADPFLPTARLSVYLRVRAAGLEAARREPRLSRRLLAAVRVPHPPL